MKFLKLHRKTSLIFVVIFCQLLWTITPYGESLPQNAITICLDGKTIVPQTPPLFNDNKVYIPARFLFEAVGSNVTWNDSDKSVTAVLGDKNIFFKMNRMVGYVNNNMLLMDAPSIIDNDRAYVRITFAAKALGYDISWDANNRKIVISSPGYIETATPTTEPVPTIEPSVEAAPPTQAPTELAADNSPKTNISTEKIFDSLNKSIIFTFTQQAGFSPIDETPSKPNAVNIITLQTAASYEMIQELSVRDLNKFIYYVLNSRIKINDYHSINVFVVYSDTSICSLTVSGGQITSSPQSIQLNTTPDNF